MKTVYCWKCKDFVPMPEEFEYARYRKVHKECLESIKRYREEHQVSLEETPLEELREPAYSLYEQITGYRPKQKSFDHLWSHSVKAFGPECKSCGKNLRTPKAKHCAECGADV